MPTGILLWWNVLSYRGYVKRGNTMLHTPRVTENVPASPAESANLIWREPGRG